jgi:hypothetical protein
MDSRLFECLAARQVSEDGHLEEAESLPSLYPRSSRPCRCASVGGRGITRSMRRIVLTGVCAMFLVLAVAGAADAYTIKGGDRWHRQMVKELLDYNPDLLAIVQNVWPNFTVNINYGGRAAKGSIDVNIRKSGKAFSDQVLHEFGHEVQLAADAKGGIPQIDNPWRQEMRDRGYPESKWVWRSCYPYYGRMSPHECFAENLGMLWPAKYHYAPDTKLAKLTQAEMWAFLKEAGALP